ncbi:MAG: adenylyl-sulfate kinase [Cytophagales bacterium]|nr:adenylyl-sulfate kinase [Cytophagales bacterium]
MKHIHPIFERTVSKERKEVLLGQKSLVIWMVGLSGSGKSTLAVGLENKLNEIGVLTQLLDGDNLRVGINSNLGFTENDRLENIRRASEVAKLFLNCGVVTICSFISPLKVYRDLASKIIGADNFFEVYVNAPYSVCEERDVKGLYKKARNGEIKNFTGLDAPFESPLTPNLEIRTDQMTLDESLETLYQSVLKRIKS